MAVTMTSLAAFVVIFAIIIIYSETGIYADAGGDSSGKNFIFSFPYRYSTRSNFQQPQVFISTVVKHPVTVTVSVPGIGFTQTVAVTNEQSSNVSLPADASIRLKSSLKVANKAVVVNSTHAVSVYGFYALHGTVSVDGFCVLPTTALGTDYMTVGYKPTLPLNEFHYSEFVVTAIEDATVLSITGPAVKLSRNLQQYESYQFVAENVTDITGMSVKADKPVSVMTGHQCATVTTASGEYTCDYLMEHLPPVTTFGNRYILAPFLGRRSGFSYRVVSLSPGCTTLFVPSGHITLLQGEFHEERTFTSSEVVTITSDKPVLVSQYAIAHYSDSIGDSFMTIIPPTERFSNNVTFPVPSLGWSGEGLYISIISECNYTGFFYLDDQPQVTPPDLQTDDAEFCVIRKSVSAGFHSVTHASVSFLVLAYGFSGSLGYGYVAGYITAKDGVDQDNTANPDDAVCPATFETVESLNTSWPVTVAENQTVHSNERCDVNTEKRGHGVAVRDCVRHNVLGAQWQKPIPVDCGNKDEPDLHKLSKTEVVESNVEDVAEGLDDVTKNLQSLTSENIDDLATTLQSIVDVGSAAPKVTETVIGIVDNVVDAAKETSSDTTENGNIVDILKAFEDQITHSTAQGQEFAPIVQKNLIVKTTSIKSQPETPVRFAIRSGNQNKDVFEEADLLEIDGDDERVREKIRTSMSLPTELFRSKSNETIGVSIVVHNSDTLFPSNTTNMTVSGDIIAAIVTGTKSVDNLTEPVALNFTVSGANPTCVFWDFDELDWSTTGCERVTTMTNNVLCHCYHLTNFAVLVDATYEKSHIVLDVISKVGCCLSICCLFITLVIFLSFRQLRSGYNAVSRKILIQFCTTLFLLYLMFVVGIDRTQHRGGCIFIAALLQYLTLASVTWMGVEAYHMYLNVVKVFDAMPEHFLLKVSVVAWGFPLLVSAISLGTSVNHYGHLQYCFVKPGNTLYYGLVLPIASILLFNTVTFGLVVRRLIRSNIGGTVQHQSKLAQMAQRLRNAFAISILMGLTWVFGFFAIEGAKFTFSLIFCLLNSLQGVVVFVLFCLRQDDVKKTLRQFIESVFNLPEGSLRITSMTANTGTGSSTSGPKHTDIGLSNMSFGNSAVAEKSGSQDSSKDKEAHAQIRTKPSQSPHDHDLKSSGNVSGESKSPTDNYNGGLMSVSESEQTDDAEKIEEPAASVSTDLASQPTSTADNDISAMNSMIPPPEAITVEVHSCTICSYETL